MFTVFYLRSNYNPYKTYYQNSNRYIASKAFKTIEDAKKFAGTVNTCHIINPCGSICE